MIPTLTQIQGSLQYLSRIELKQLKTSINALLSVTSESYQKDDVDSETLRILKILCEVYERKSGEETPAYIFAKMTGIQAFKEKIPLLVKFAARCSEKRNQQDAILKLGIELLYDNLMEMGFPFTARSMIAQVHRVPACINAAFPGYSSSMLAFAVNSKIQEHV